MSEKRGLPEASIARLCMLYTLLGDLVEQGQARVSSSELGRILDIAPHSIRKDISLLGEVGNVGSGYDTTRLRAHIRDRLHLERPRNACVVGLGKLGTAILGFERFRESGITMVAGFDSNINRLETIRTSIEVFPAYEIAEIVQRKKIVLGVIAVPPLAAQEAADRLMRGGVRGIVNFSPAPIRHNPEKVFVTTMDVEREFAILSARIAFNNE
ncbi:MAG: redox-sensing transcriptional repressor Rex [Chitinivibrionales bacterium]|nr:redox-sensing transcriptional repressor Rex [Chitinivibrionales bacterium]MBD3358521.1 redox-sensing transcriptional repressor Rex [Chitinivibrionales bacterium]